MTNNTTKTEKEALSQWLGEKWAEKMASSCKAKPTNQTRRVKTIEINPGQPVCFYNMYGDSIPATSIGENDGNYWGERHGYQVCSGLCLVGYVSRQLTQYGEHELEAGNIIVEFEDEDGSNMYGGEAPADTFKGLRDIRDDGTEVVELENEESIRKSSYSELKKQLTDKPLFEVEIPEKIDEGEITPIDPEKTVFAAELERRHFISQWSINELIDCIKELRSVIQSQEARIKALESTREGGEG